MSLKENDIVAESKKEAEDEEAEDCEFCEGQGWYWLGRDDNMWKEKCECQKEKELELKADTAKDNEI